MTNGWPSRSDSHCPSRRPTMSGPLPGTMPMIKRTGRSGYACALANRDTAGSAAAPAARCKNVRRGSFMLNLPSRHSITSSARASSVVGTSREIRKTAFMECPASTSPYCDVRRFDDRCPTSNLAFYQCCEWLLASPLFARDVAAKVGQALAYVLVIECLVECIRERVENRLRYALRRKQRPPRQRLKLRQAGLYRSWDIW